MFIKTIKTIGDAKYLVTIYENGRDKATVSYCKGINRNYFKKCTGSKAEFSAYCNGLYTDREYTKENRRIGNNGIRRIFEQWMECEKFNEDAKQLNLFK